LKRLDKEGRRPSGHGRIARHRSLRYASVLNVAAFIDGETDDTLLVDLIWGLSLIEWSAVKTKDVPWTDNRRSQREVHSSSE
jgi:CRISPR-associated protein Csx17